MNRYLFLMSDEVLNVHEPGLKVGLRLMIISCMDEWINLWTDRDEHMSVTVQVDTLRCESKVVQFS